MEGPPTELTVRLDKPFTCRCCQLLLVTSILGERLLRSIQLGPGQKVLDVDLGIAEYAVRLVDVLTPAFHYGAEHANPLSTH